MDSSTSEVKGIGGSAIALFIFSLVAVIFIGMFFLIRGYLNSAQSMVTSQMDDLMSQAYTQYDDVTQTGAEVLSCIKTYRNADISIFVATYNSMNVKDYFKPDNIGSDYTGYYYCGVPADSAGKALDTTKAQHLYYKDLKGKVGTVFCVDAMSTAESSNYDVQHNTQFSPLTTQSKTEQYVKTSSKFYSKCFYSETTGEVVGIAFFQLN